MTVQEAIGKWTDAATVAKTGEQFIRDGNWQAIERAMRHCKEGTTVAEDGVLNGDTVLLVTPANVEPAAGKSAMKLAPFYLVVK